MRLAVIALVVPSLGLVAQEKVDFARQIAPILVQRCVECHGPEKDKGDLRLDQRAHAFPEGEEDYWTIHAGKPGESELIRRITLPVGDDDIMPEKGEPLSKAQQELFSRWVAEGAEWPEAGDEAIAAALAAAVIPMITFELPAVDAAAGEAIERAMQALRDKGAVVQRVAADTEAIDVNLSLLRDKITDADLALLEPLAPRLVWLNVSRTAITDAGAAVLGKLTQLRRLHAANTKLGDAAVARLRGLEQLEFANFYGTAITDESLHHFRALPKLEKLHAWQTGVTAAGKQALEDRGAVLRVDIGDYAEARMAAAAKEIAEREAAKAAEEAAKAAEEAKNKPVNELCPVTDKPIDKDQFVEHEGRKVAFCCGNCKAKFEKDPAKYAGKLPEKKE